MNNQILKDLKTTFIYIGFSTFMFLFQMFTTNTPFLNSIAEYSLARGAAVLGYMFSAQGFGVDYYSKLNLPGTIFQYILFLLMYQLVSFLIINCITLFFTFKPLKKLLGN
jgi:hypothetical protein